MPTRKNLKPNKERRARTAFANQQNRAGRSTTDQLQELDSRPGESKRERARLTGGRKKKTNG